MSVDGRYRFSLDVFQVGELGLKVGREYTEDELVELEQESQYGKLYARTLDYCLMRPHSEKEVKDYLWRKTRPTRAKDGQQRPGVSQEIAERVLARLKGKRYIDDEKFARYWIDNRNLSKGASRRKLIAELRAKGVEQSIIDHQMSQTVRDEQDELHKVINKKRSRYPDEQKLTTYLLRQGFSYDDVRRALADD